MRIMGMKAVNKTVSRRPVARPVAPIRKGRTMDEATAEAHDRESRIEEATKQQESEKKSAEMPPDDGEWGSWQR